MTETATVGRRGRGEKEPSPDQQLAEELVERARSQGLELLGDGGLLQQMTKAVLERGLAEELTDHLGYEPYDPAGNGSGNSRNGTSAKRVLTEGGAIDLDVPRDRAGTFEPQLVRKGQRRLGGIDKIVIGLYAHGMTVRDIRDHLAEIYDVDVSPDLISKITDSVLEEVKEWQQRALEPVYPVVFLDAIICKVRDNGTVINKAAHLAVGVDVDGKKEVLGIWVETTEGAKFWLRVMNELKARGVQDVLIVVCDGLKGLPAAIEAVWPKATVQTSSIDTGWRRDGLAGHRATGRGPMQTRCLRGPHADLSLPVEAGRVVASGSCASSAVMRFQAGQPFGDVSRKDIAVAGFHRGRIGCR